MMRKKTILKKLAEVLNKLTDGYYGKPSVLDQTNGFSQPTLCWDGPYDWVSFTGGQSYCCGELGNYSLKIEPELQGIIDLAKENGYYFEPNNCCQICLAD
jgi:hypothetical protein